MDPLNCSVKDWSLPEHLLTDGGDDAAILGYSICVSVLAQ